MIPYFEFSKVSVFIAIFFQINGSDDTNEKIQARRNQRTFRTRKKVREGPYLG